MTRKRDYLEKKDLLKSTEDFIDLGASASSSSYCAKPREWRGRALRAG